MWPRHPHRAPQVDPSQPGMRCCPCLTSTALAPSHMSGLTLILTICSHSLVPTSWRRSSSSTASQLSSTHLHREGTRGRSWGGHSQRPPPSGQAQVQLTL